MRTTLSTICLVTVCSVVTFGAQAPGTKPEQGAMKLDAPVTIVGCVAAGTGAGQFELTNAMMASAMAQEKMNEKAKTNAGATYMLTGGENLKAHMGHKVEVTGTLAKMTGHDKMAGEKPAAAAKDPSAAAKVHGTVAVTAVKMVSATCP